MAGVLRMDTSLGAFLIIVMGVLGIVVVIYAKRCVSLEKRVAVLGRAVLTAMEKDDLPRP